MKLPKSRDRIVQALDEASGDRKRRVSNEREARKNHLEAHREQIFYAVFSNALILEKRATSILEQYYHLLSLVNNRDVEKIKHNIESVKSEMFHIDPWNFTVFDNKSRAYKQNSPIEKLEELRQNLEWRMGLMVNNQVEIHKHHEKINYEKNRKVEIIKEMTDEDKRILGIDDNSMGM